jgi:hypothetical protein
MIIVTAGGDHGGRVVEAGEANEWMGGALDEERLIDEGTDPGENEREKLPEDRLHERRQIGEFWARVGGRE